MHSSLYRWTAFVILFGMCIHSAGSQLTPNDEDKEILNLKKFREYHPRAILWNVDGQMRVYRGRGSKKSENGVLQADRFHGILGKDFVTIGEDQTVLPTQDPLVDPNDKVDITLTCTGSRPELSFYIINRLTWSYIGPKGEVKNITESFYPAPNFQFAVDNFKTGHFSLKYFLVDNTYVFMLKISGVTHADNGIYRCSLLNEHHNITDSKDVMLTVLHPVENISIEILTKDDETIATRYTPIMDGEPNVELTPGQYKVICEAGGSNPVPALSLFFNEARPAVSVVKHVDASGNRVKNMGRFVKKITVNAHTMPQTLQCNANIPGGHFPEQQAGFTMMVQVDKPDIKCSNITTRLGDRYAKIMCNISAQGLSNAGLVCEKVSWLLGNENQRIENEQRWKDPSKKFDIMESQCGADENGLKVSLTFYELKPSHFVKMYYLVYGIGEASHRIPVQLHEDNKPDIKCSNITTRLGDRYAKVMCNISAQGLSNAGLVCEKVSWLLGNENQRIEDEQRWKDPSKKFDIMESQCGADENGLKVSLTFYELKPSHFVEMYYLVYGIGEASHRIPVQLHEDTTAGVAGVGASLSLLLCVVMAAVAKHLVL